MTDIPLKGPAPRGSLSPVAKTHEPVKSSDILNSVLMGLDAESAASIRSKLRADGFEAVPTTIVQEVPQEVANSPVSTFALGQKEVEPSANTPLVCGWTQPKKAAEAAVIQTFALPGSTIRIYNASVLESGRPKLIKKVTAPEEDVEATAGTKASQKADEFKGKRPDEGMVLTSIPLIEEDDHQAWEMFLVTIQPPLGFESEPAPLRLFQQDPMAFKNSTRRRPFSINYSQFRLERGVVKTVEDFTVPAMTQIFVRHPDLKTARGFLSDAKGQFSVDLEGLSRKGLQIRLTNHSGLSIELDLDCFGAPFVARTT